MPSVGLRRAGEIELRKDRNRRLYGKFSKGSLWLFGVDERPGLFVHVSSEIGEPRLSVFRIGQSDFV